VGRNELAQDRVQWRSPANTVLDLISLLDDRKCVSGSKVGIWKKADACFKVFSPVSGLACSEHTSQICGYTILPGVCWCIQKLNMSFSTIQVPYSLAVSVLVSWRCCINCKTGTGITTKLSLRSKTASKFVYKNESMQSDLVREVAHIPSMKRSW